MEAKGEEVWGGRLLGWFENWRDQGRGGLKG